MSKCKNCQVLGDEIARNNKNYICAVSGRKDFRKAFADKRKQNKSLMELLERAEDLLLLSYSPEHDILVTEIKALKG